MQLTIDRFSEIQELKKDFKATVDTVQEELNEHLDSINQNSMEIQANYDFMEEINSKLEKLSSRLDDLELAIKSRPQFESSSNLDDKEKEVFLVLYTSQEPLSFEEISARSSIPIYVVEETIEQLETKRIPIVRKNFAGKILLLLEEEFKVQQSKTGVVDIKN